jgi:hypothetical protein
MTLEEAKALYNKMMTIKGGISQIDQRIHTELASIVDALQKLEPVFNALLVESGHPKIATEDLAQQADELAKRIRELGS